MAFTPRLTAPTNFSSYYTERRIPVSPTGTETGWQYFYSGDYTYTNTGAHTGNCTWYAMGRSAEIANLNLYDEFRKLSQNSIKSVQSGRKLSTLDSYLHVERHVEKV